MQYNMGIKELNSFHDLQFVNDCFYSFQADLFIKTKHFYYLSNKDKC